MKLVGIFILSLIPVILSFRWSGELRQKQKLRKAFGEFLAHVHFQIENFLREQKEILSHYENPVLEKSAFYQEYRCRLSKTPCDAFDYAWKKHGKDFGFDGECEEILGALAQHFGLQEKGAQLAELKHALSLLEPAEAKDKKECENKVKILHVSGITAGLGIMILLL